jgi:hypothetical protein
MAAPSSGTTFVTVGSQLGQLATSERTDQTASGAAAMTMEDSNVGMRGLPTWITVYQMQHGT